MQTIMAILVLVLTMGCATDRPENHISGKKSAIAAPSLPEQRKDLASSYGRMQNNMVDVLFKEASEQNEDLQRIVESFEQMDDLEQDNLAQYRKFASELKSFWRDANSHTTLFKDTLLQKEIEKVVARQELRHKERMAPFRALEKTIQEARSTALDEFKALKMMVALAVVQDFQRQNAPEIEPLKVVKKSFDSVTTTLREERQRVKIDG